MSQSLKYDLISGPSNEHALDIHDGEMLDISNYRPQYQTIPACLNSAQSEDQLQTNATTSNMYNNEHSPNVAAVTEEICSRVQNTSCSTLNKPTDNLKKLFISWGLTDLFQRFEDKKCTVDTLKYLRYRHLDNFFAPPEIADQIKFEHFLFSWQTENGIVNEFSTICSKCKLPTDNTSNVWRPDESKSVQNDSQNQSSTKIKHVRVHEILNKNKTGTNIKSFYEKHKRLHKQQRALLCDLIVDYYLLQLNFKPSAQQIRKLAQEIIECFPNENVKTYYIHRGHKSPIGKLYNKFNYGHRKFSGTENVRNRSETKVTDLSMESIVLDTLNDEEYAEIKILLKNLRSPRETVLEKWKITSSNRVKELLSNTDASLQNIFNSWPIYKNPLMPELIDIDFNTMYPNRCLYTNWSKFDEKIFSILDDKLTQPIYKKQLAALREQKPMISLDSYNTELLLLLCTILPNSIRHSKMTAYSRNTIKDSQDWFIITVENIFQMEMIIKERKTLCESDHIKIQPYLFAIGKTSQYTQFAIMLDDIKYICGSLLEAIDKSFKIFQIFQLQYPVPSYNVWLFIQKYLYNINTTYDVEVPAVATLISDLEQQN